MNNALQLKTGGDPRTLPDYAALRDEIGKLAHPARPDVNWRYAEKLCLSLFEQNGVELQTAAWYTLARTHLAGLFGLNEGLSILEALISHQWGGLWPQAVHARIEILSSLSHRIQQMMRTLSLNYSDLSQLYQAEQLLTRLEAIFQRLELKHLSQLETLRTLMHNSAVRLENSDSESDRSAVALPDISIAATNEPAEAVKWVYVAQPEFQPNVEVMSVIPSPTKPWKPFAAGMAAMLVISAATVWGWNTFHQPDRLQTALATTFAPLPARLSSAQLEGLRQQNLPAQAAIKNTRQQLTRLSQLPPDWSVDYSRQLVQQALVLWPEQAKPLAQEWQQQRKGAALPMESLNGWNEGMTKLQQLSDKLNGLDEQKGKYITVSELKSVMFTAMQAFNRTVPAEEQLRTLAQTPAGQPLPAVAQSQLEMHLKQLTAQYGDLKHREEK